MIISFRHKFIFVALSKTASHSFRVALRPHLGPRDWEQCQLFVKKAFPVAALAAIGHGHLTCHDIAPYLLPGMWTNYFTFCTVRHPIDRFVSHCCFIYRDTEELRKDPVALMKRSLTLPQHEVAFRPQSDYIYDCEDRLLVDHVCRFEDLQQHFDVVCQTIGLAAVPLTHTNRSVHLESLSYLDDELREMIVTKYKRDFQLLGYLTSPS